MFVEKERGRKVPSESTPFRNEPSVERAVRTDGEVRERVTPPYI